ncbi:uncharacterized protein EURHEDRAFT_380640 [Aspergillus ruber CBS 135680]|uniref:Uncharacterized protein n=1 Tax=Aspergillus ruber (strain CBS 135680) TaxID=1388766 RepID=A0A017S4W1_ASPRC|nr:uncharacterized protein EURHEDRAFT_380640 [Aspergillus ruber CBS 135680]EYE91982.1 hypothetical protein EURHEDRAFT_380640 [Aspergillus ruber CBS 135680]
MARHWYHKAADKRPNFGQIQQHLAVLAWPDMLQELFYYTKSLVSVGLFPPAGERITSFFQRVSNEPKPDYLLIFSSVFVTAHGTLLTQGSLSDFRMHVDLHLLYLNEYICQLGSEFKMHGVPITSCNFAAIFQYGSTNAVLSNEFKEGLAQDEINLTVLMNWTPVENLDTIEAEFCEYQNSQSQEKLVYYSAHVTFKMIWSNMDFHVAEDRKCFPEDFLFRRQVRSQRYFSADYFEGALAEDNGRSIQVLSLTIARMYRCLWLGVQLAKFDRWIMYDSSISPKFSVTQFALNLENRAQRCDI